MGKNKKLSDGEFQSLEEVQRQKKVSRGKVSKWFGWIVSLILLGVIAVLLLTGKSPKSDIHYGDSPTVVLSENPFATVPDPENNQVVVNELNKQVLRSMVQVNINTNITLDTSTSEAFLSIANTGFDGTYLKHNTATGSFTLENKLEGHEIDVPFKVKEPTSDGSMVDVEYVYKYVPEEYWVDTLIQCIIEDAHGNIIYNSQGIQYGKSIHSAKLDKELAPGTYQCTAKFYKYYPNGEKVGPGVTPVTITVGK